MSSVGFIDVPIRYSVFNVMVLSISPPAQMLLLNDSMKSQVRVYSNPNEFTEVTLTTTILADTTTIDFNFGMQTAALIYLDNFIANIQ